MEEARYVSSEISRHENFAAHINEAALWKRLLDPISSDLSPEAAQYFLTLQFPQTDLERMNELAEKAREGALTLDEQLEAENYERVGQILSLIKSRARQVLKKARTIH